MQGVAGDSSIGGQRIPFVPPPLGEVAALFPHLEIVTLLGAGGMGAVYKARQPALDRFVALKILPASHGGEGNFSERFNREARALARLSHPNIVAVHEFGQAGRLHYFLMEFVDGANLRQLEIAGRLSAREALQIIPQICDALQYAHDEGVVHRDIKPENVLIDRKGRVKIADFGLAKILGHDPEAARLTAEGQVMGTPHYMAPEQVERPLSVDHRADIYSLGVVFYEMLTGDLPLGKFPPPSRKVQVDVRLDEIVLRALENDPARRYQKASEVKQGVATVTESGAAVPSSPPINAATPGGTLETEAQFLRWAGIPVVVERDGEREVYFQGALAAIFVTMLVAAVAQMLVRWLTGTEHALSQWVWLSGAVIVFWGLRRTLHRPSALPQSAQNGTRILPAKKRLPYLGDALMLVALFGFVVGSHYFKKWVLDLPSKSTVATSPAIATLNPASGIMSARLSGGGDMELLAIANSPATRQSWWRPNGSLISNSIYRIAGLADRTVPAKTTRKDLVFRITGRPNGFESPIFDCDPAIDPAIGGVITENGQSLAGGWALRDTWESKVKSGTLRLGYGSGSWRTVLRANPEADGWTGSWTAKHLGKSDDPNWMTSMRNISTTNDDVVVTATMGPESFSLLQGASGGVTVSPGRHAKNWRLRVVLLDAQGNERVPDSAESKPAFEIEPFGRMQWEFHFTGLSLTAVKEVCMQVQPLYWVEFHDVVLQPPGESPASEAALIFGPVIERTFDELIDFDTGRAASFPTGKSAENVFAAIGENILWAQENGYDASASNSELDNLGTEFAPVSKEEWDSLTPQDVITRLRQSASRPRSLKLESTAELPVTYAYRTREQGVGIVQIFAFDPERPKVAVRLKRIIPIGGDGALDAQGDAPTGAQK